MQDDRHQRYGERREIACHISILILVTFDPCNLGTAAELGLE